MRFASEKILFQISQFASIFVGSLLFIIGLCGTFGVFIRPIAEISFLIEPLGLAPHYDELYWYACIFVGVWLVLFLWIRIAAIAAIALIIFKGAMVNNQINF